MNNLVFSRNPTHFSNTFNVAQYIPIYRINDPVSKYVTYTHINIYYITDAYINSDVFKLLREKPTEPKEKTKKVLNAMITLPSGDSRVDGVAPPVLAAEFITTDLSAEFLATALHYFRRKEYDVLRSPDFVLHTRVFDRSRQYNDNNKPARY